ncbi:MAG: carotenoid oxygenase family protein, partial [Alphaproteobacteria bacterium]
MSSNPYLEDNYGPIGHETTATDLRVEGELPRELDGLYLRNGPDPIPPIDAANHHWFLGDGMVHGVRLRVGRAEWYRSRWVGRRRLAKQRGAEDVAGP